MPKLCYIPKKFSVEHRMIIDQANEIIDQYAQQGFSLTLRQLYYQFVARAWLPNTQQQYKRLGTIISAARKAGEIDWLAIEDRTRFVREISKWSHPGSIIESCAHSYATYRWRNQKSYLEVWIEKDALVGVFEPICNELDLPLFSCRGYASDSEVWSAAQRLISKGKPSIILHFGDHDPSGLDMTRDIEERLYLFRARDVTIERMALNMDQVNQYDPPPNPAKMTDSRYSSYSSSYGDKSWELDALDPTVLSGLVQEAFDKYVDQKQWDEDTETMENERGLLSSLADNWDDVVPHIP